MKILIGDIITNACNIIHSADRTFHFRDIDSSQSSLKLINREKEILGEKVSFSDNVKWIRVDDFERYPYKTCYDPSTPFKKFVQKRAKNH